MSVYSAVTGLFQSAFPLGSGSLVAAAALGGELAAFVCAHPGYVRVVSAERGEVARAVLDKPAGVAAVNAGEFVVGDGGDVVVYAHWRGEHLREVRRWSAETEGLVGVGFAEGMVVSVGKEGGIRWWGAGDGELCAGLDEEELRGGRWRVSVGAGGEVVCAEDSGQIRVYRAMVGTREQGRCVKRYPARFERTEQVVCGVGEGGQVVFVGNRGERRGLLELLPRRVRGVGSRESAGEQGGAGGEVWYVTAVVPLHDGRFAVVGRDAGDENVGVGGLVRLEEVVGLVEMQFAHFAACLEVLPETPQAGSSAVGRHRGRAAGRHGLHRTASDSASILKEHVDVVGDVGAEEGDVRLPQCVICLDMTVSAALVPCGHAKFCTSCAGDVVYSGRCCPICRRECASVLTLYF